MTPPKPRPRERKQRSGPRRPGSKPGRTPTRDQVDGLVTLFRERRFEQSLAAAREFVRAWPGLGFGWNLLAASHQALDDPEAAVAAYRRALEIEPGNADAHNNLGNICRGLGRLEESMRALERAVALKPGFVEALFNLALTCTALERYEKAESAIREVIRLRPEFADGHNQLGNQYRAQGRLEEAAAAYRHALEAQPRYAAVISNLASVTADMGSTSEAGALYRRALEIDPRAPDILSNLATLLVDAGRLTEAESCGRAALETDAGSADLQNNLGVILQKQGRLMDAEQAFARAVELDPDSTSAWHNLGNVVMDLGRLDQAEECHRKAVAGAPDSAAAHRNLGVTLAVLGRPDEAKRSYRKALGIEPGRAEVHYRLAEVRKYEANDPDLANTEALLERPGIPDSDRVYLHYAAGKAYADIGSSFDLSFRHYAEGAEKRRSLIAYDVDADEACFQRIAEVFSVETLDGIKGSGYDSGTPVFVVGMPRSGTTLVENLLAGHPYVHGAGERFDVDQIVGDLSRDQGSGFPDWVSGLNTADWERMGQRYVDRLLETSPQASRIVDKMPNNFRYLGLLAGCLPGARVIHVYRNPLDTCVSCFTHLFENEQLYSYELRELGRFYRAYAGLMRHWQSVLPAEFLLHVRYEDIVHAPERSVRTMLAHCDLPWDPGCLNFQDNRRAIATASLTQVRQPIYGSAVGRWKAYAGHLEPLIESLEDLGVGDVDMMAVA